MATTLTINGTDHRWESFGLDALLDMDAAEFRNERDSGYGDSEGEWFATPEDPAIGPDGTRYRVLFTGTHGNDHSPGASHYTQAELFPVDDPLSMAAYNHAVSYCESQPENDPDDDETE